MFYISICSIFNSIGICIGLPRNGTIECYLQAFLTNAFPLSVIFWTTAIAYMVFCIIHKAQKIKVDSKPLWAATFVLPVVLTLLPLTTETYGSPEEDDWCFVKERASSSSPPWTTLFWSIFCFYGWLYLNVLVYIVLLAVTLRHIYTMGRGVHKDSITLSKMKASLYKLIWYPLITLVVWLPSAIYDVTELDNDSSGGRYTSNSSQYLAYLLPTTHGILMCGAFFATNRDVQLVLRELWQGRGLPENALLESLIAAERTSSLADRGSHSRSGSGSNPGSTPKTSDSNSPDFVPPSLSLAAHTSSSPSSSSSSVSQAPTGTTSSSGVRRGGGNMSTVKKKEPAIPNPLGWSADDGDGGDHQDDTNYV